MKYASSGLRPGRILIWGVCLVGGLFLSGRMMSVLQQSYVDQVLVQGTVAGKAALMERAFKQGADPNARTPDANGSMVPVLFVAIRKGDLALCRELLEHGARPDAAEFARSGQPRMNAVMEASRLGKARVLRLLLDHGASPNAHDDAGFTALMCAAISGDTATVQLLMDRGADVNRRDSRGFSPLLMAEARHRDAVWTQLARAGATR